MSLSTCFMLITHTVYSSTLKTEAIFSSETMVDFHESKCFHSGIFLGSFDPEDGGDMFLRNVDRLSTDYTAFYPRR
jgi:hypothetical protein